MARPKPKRVKINIEVDMTGAGWKELKPVLKAQLEAALLPGELVYLATEVEDKE